MRDGTGWGPGALGHAHPRLVSWWWSRWRGFAVVVGRRAWAVVVVESGVGCVWEGEEEPPSTMRTAWLQSVTRCPPAAS